MFVRFSTEKNTTSPTLGSIEEANGRLINSNYSAAVIIHNYHGERHLSLTHLTVTWPGLSHNFFREAESSCVRQFVFSSLFPHTETRTPSLDSIQFQVVQVSVLLVVSGNLRTRLWWREPLLRLWLWLWLWLGL